jgi:hypothetical protein
MKESICCYLFSVKGHKNCYSVDQWSFSVSLWSCPICTIIDENKYIFLYIHIRGSCPSSNMSKYWWQYLLVHFTSSCIILEKKSMAVPSDIESCNMRHLILSQPTGLQVQKVEFGYSQSIVWSLSVQCHVSQKEICLNLQIIVWLFI